MTNCKLLVASPVGHQGHVLQWVVSLQQPQRRLFMRKAEVALRSDI